MALHEETKNPNNSLAKKKHCCSQSLCVGADREDTTGEAPCGAHVFEGFFGLENGPVKSDKSQEKTLFGKDFPKPAKTQS